MAGSVSRSAFSVLTENEVNERGDLVLFFLRKFFESLVVILNQAARIRRHNQLVGFSAKGPRYGMQYADAGAAVAVQNAVNGGLANTGSVRDFFSEFRDGCEPIQRPRVKDACFSTLHSSGLRSPSCAGASDM